MVDTQFRTREEPRPHAELFVLHAPADDAWVRAFLLPELGLERDEVVTARDFTPGAVTVEEFERAVRTARVTVLVLSPAFGADLWSVFGELLASHDTVGDGSARLVPLLLAPYELPLRLDFRVRLDCTERSRWEPEIARLRDLLGRREPAAEELPCPYPGLMAFGPDDGRFFFGRDDESDLLCRRLRHQDFLLVLGPSGSGKSSLVCAGVLPRLAAEDGGRWLTRVLRPGPAPLRTLSDVLGGDVAAASGERLAQLVDTLLLSSPGADRLLLFVDQLEEGFVQPTKAERGQFLAALDRLRRVRRCVLVLAMRADFYGDLMSCALWPVDSWERVEVPPLRAAALREAITRPAAAAGVYVDPILVERLVRDAAEEPGALPLVQETLVLLWARRARRLLTAAAYEALGTTGENRLAVALASRADGVVAALAPGRRTIARRVLVRLVQLGEGRQDTRRRQTVAALRGSGDDPVEFRATLRHLADERLVILGGGEGHEETADLPHEAMIAGWPTLRHWIDESRADELRRRRIELDARDWNANERDAAELYRGRRLADALEWAHVHASELGETASAFLAAGRRRRLLGRLNASAVAAVAAVAVVAAVWLSIPSMKEAWLRRQANQQGQYVHLAGGTALVGTGNRPVRVRGLDVDRFEVSNGRYRLCVRAGQCRRPDEPFGQSPYDNGNNNLPVVFVNADQAAAFCSWLGRRLPTMAEWERAARGLTGRRYPWGGTPPGPSQVNAIKGDEEPPAPVPADDPRFRSGDTPEGIRHLIGNVSEWVATRVGYGPNGEAVVIGDWNRRDGAASLALMGGGADEQVAPAATGSVADAVHQAGWTGFRCVRTRE